MKTETATVDARRFTIRTCVGYPYGKDKACRRGDTLLCDNDKLPERGDMVMLIRHDGEALAWRCDCPPVARQGAHYVFGFVKEDGGVVYFNTGEFARSGVIVDSRPSDS